MWDCHLHPSFFATNIYIISKKLTSVVGSNVKVRSNVILVLPNVTMKLSNVRKKMKLLNVTKVLLYVMLVLSNVTMKPSNVRKNKRTAKCDKSTVTCDIGIA